jgi:hypothetical protein
MWLSAAIANQNWKIVSWLPFLGAFLIFAGALCDIDEGSALRKLLKSYPKLAETDVARANRNTRFKWLLLLPGLATLLVGAAVLGIALLKAS